MSFDDEMEKAKQTLAGMWRARDETAKESESKKDPFRLDNMTGYSQAQLDVFNSAWLAIVAEDQLEPGGEYYDATLVKFANSVREG